MATVLQVLPSRQLSPLTLAPPTQPYRLGQQLPLWVDPRGWIAVPRNDRLRRRGVTRITAVNGRLLISRPEAALDAIADRLESCCLPGAP